jgi:hypothetical protein
MAEYDFEASIKWFVEQPQPMRESILTTLEKSKPIISVGLLASRVAKVTGADGSYLKSLFGWVAPLAVLGATDKDFRKTVVEISLRMAGGEAATTESRPEDARSLARLFSCEVSIGLTGKAQDIIWGHGKVFSDANTVSQIRPLFLNDLEAKADSAVIVHELRIEFREGEANASVCLIMDTEKIQKLQTVLDRAIRKESSLRKSSLFDYLTADGG